MTKKIKKVGIALQGGGAHGAFTWGVLDRLLEVDEIVADAMCGTSAGAVNAVVCAYGLHVGGPPKAKELMEQLWKKIANSGSFLFKPGVMDQFFGKGDIYNSPGYLWFNAMTQFMSPYNFNPFNYNPLRDLIIPVYAERNQLRIPDYHRLDIAYTLGRGYKRDRRFRTSWTLSVYNLYARRNAFSVYFPRDDGRIPQANRLTILGTALPALTFNLEIQ